MFKTSGALTLQMTTPTVNYYLLNGGGGGGGGRVASNPKDSEAGAGGGGGTSLHGTAIFSDVENYTIVIGNGLSASSTKNANNSGGGITSISGSGVNVQTSGQIDNGGDKQWWYRNHMQVHDGEDGLVENFNFGAGGGSGGVIVNTSYNFSPGNGGYNGGGNGGLYYQDGFNGQANTGGGGGGGGCGHTTSPYRFYNKAGGSGGSGVAIIRLPEGKFSYTGTYVETTLEFP